MTKPVPVTRRAVHTATLAVMPYAPKTDYTRVSHELPLQPMCPISGNPMEGSTVTVSYVPTQSTLEVVSLRDYLDAFVGGRRMDDGTEVVSMEDVVERLAVDAAEALRVRVSVAARLLINPGQTMCMDSVAFPWGA